MRRIKDLTTIVTNIISFDHNSSRMKYRFDIFRVKQTYIEICEHCFYLFTFSSCLVILLMTLQMPGRVSAHVALYRRLKFLVMN